MKRRNLLGGMGGEMILRAKTKLLFEGRELTEAQKKNSQENLAEISAKNDTEIISAKTCP